MCPPRGDDAAFFLPVVLHGRGGSCMRLWMCIGASRFSKPSTNCPTNFPKLLHLPSTSASDIAIVAIQGGSTYVLARLPYAKCSAVCLLDTVLSSPYCSHVSFPRPSSGLWPCAPAPVPPCMSSGSLGISLRVSSCARHKRMSMPSVLASCALRILLGSPITTYTRPTATFSASSWGYRLSPRRLCI
jgi:hypothetical protein